MLLDKSSNLYVIKTLIILIIIATAWTSISLYYYYTGPQFKIDTYMTYLARKEYAKVYDLVDLEEVSDIYSKEQIINYYTRIYELENSLVEISRRNKIIIKPDIFDKATLTAFSNIRYIYTNKEHVTTLYLVKKDNKWLIKFPFALSEVKVYAPIGSTVYMNGKKITHYEGETYIESNVLPGEYALQVEFPNNMYNTYNKIINVPDEKDVFLPYNTLNVEIATVKNMIVELEGVQRKSEDGRATFSNILEGNYKMKVYSPNHYIEPIEMNITVNKEKRLFSVLEVQLSEVGKENFGKFISNFYSSYINDIKGKRCVEIMPYLNEETNSDFIYNFKQWFIENKDTQEAKVVVKPSNTRVDQLGFIHTDLLETIELTNKEFDEYENCEVDRKYKIVLEWDTIIDMSEKEWLIIDRKVKQSIVSYQDLEGKWIQY